MKKKETLFDILLKVSELRMDIETAEKRILRLFNVSNSLDLRELERKLDESLGKETRETLIEYLKQKRQ